MSQKSLHLSHHYSLILILFLGTISILTFRFNPLLRPISIYSTALLYIVWGILHHQRVGHLRLKVVLEYFLVALLAVVIINTIL